MDSVQLSTRPQVEPTLPVALRLKIGSVCSIKQEGVGRVLASHLDSHPHDASISGCRDPCCVYLNWFLDHYQNCHHKESCRSCKKLVEWMHSHFPLCAEGRENGTVCPLGTVCKEAKKNCVRNLTKPFVNGPMDSLNSSGRNSAVRTPGTPNYNEDDFSRRNFTRLHNGGHVTPNGSHMTPNGNHVTTGGSHMTYNGNHVIPNGHHVPQNEASSITSVPSDRHTTWNGHFLRRNESSEFHNGCSEQNGAFSAQNGYGEKDHSKWNGSAGQSASADQSYNFQDTSSVRRNGDDLGHQNGNGILTTDRFWHSQHEQLPYSSPLVNGGTEARSNSLTVPHKYEFESSNGSGSCSPPVSHLRSVGDVGVDLSSLEDPQGKLFNRNMSICSTVSGRGSLSRDEAAYLQQLYSRRRSSTATNSESTADYSTSSIGTDLFSRQSSADLNGGFMNGTFGRRGKGMDSELSHIQEDCTSNFEISTVASNATSSPARLQKQSSKNRLAHMDHVPENFDGRGYESPPTHHAPIQRAGTGDSSMRMLVAGLRRSPVTHAYECSGDMDHSGSEDQLSSGEFEGINSSRANSSSSGTDSRDEGHISFPMQRDQSIENGTTDKMLLQPGRGSITMATMQNLVSFGQLRSSQGHSHADESTAGGESIQDERLDDVSARAKRVDFSHQHGGKTYISSPNLSPRHTGQMNSSEMPVTCNDHYNYSNHGQDPAGDYRVNSEGALGMVVDPEESLVSPSLLQRINQPQPGKPRPAVDNLGLDFSELSLTRNKAESESSNGTVVFIPSEQNTLNILLPSTPNEATNGASRFVDHPLPNGLNTHTILREGSQPLLESGDSAVPELGTENNRRNGDNENDVSDDDNASECSLDPHIFANHQYPRNLSGDEANSSFASSHTHQSSVSDSEASMSYVHRHAHQSSMSDSDYETTGRTRDSLRQGSAVEPVNSMFKRIDELQELHKEDLKIMRSRRELMIQQRPLLTTAQQDVRMEEAEATSPMDWPNDGDVPPEGEEPEDQQRPAKLYEMELEAYKESLTPVNPDKVAKEEVNHREYLRHYLTGQFYSQRMYREGTHWQRGHQLGKGGQATCYSIIDNNTRLALALKEELENDKSLDEAYVCLKLAYEFNVSRNIVEYFCAALLPGYCHKPSMVQLFMEIMPTNMQSYLHKNGPLPMSDVHHFSFQLFDALEFLHNRELIIHCDIKPANLLVDYTAQHLKLADFGAAELLEKRQALGDRATNNCGGTLHYNPPEHYREAGECSFALDQWQAGCCVLAMCTGRRPWRHLYMDPLPNRTTPTTTRGLATPPHLTSPQISFSSLKSHYANIIGRVHQGHMVPGFVDSTIKRLLHGCLNSDPSCRLTAVDCRQLLAYCDDLSEDQRTTVQEAIGCPTSLPEVLKSSDHLTPRLDVFLARHYKEVPYKCHTHTLYPGWVGTLPYTPSLIYQDLPFFTEFPVLSHLPQLNLSVWEGSPQEFFVATNPSCSKPSPPTPSSSSQPWLFNKITDYKQKVDPNKFIILF